MGSAVGVLPGTVGSGVAVGITITGTTGEGSGDGMTVWTTSTDGSPPHATTSSAMAIDSPRITFTVDDATPVCGLFGLSISDRTIEPDW